MPIPEHVFRAYDIRGRADADLDDDLVERIGRAFVTLTDEDRPRVAVGRDCRVSSPRIFAALTRGLQAVGAEVLDLGVGPSPLTYFAAHHLAPAGAIMITGSHNPPEDNGLKMMVGKRTLFGDDIQQLRRACQDPPPAAAQPGSIAAHALQADYIAAVRAATGPIDTSLRFVVDAGNGSAGPLALATLRALGLEPDAMFCEMDGSFPNHHPDPTVPKNLAPLIERVRQSDAAFGVAYDGDGDRIGVVDERGQIIWGDKLLILLARGVLEEHPGAAIIGEVKCSETLYDDIRKHGGRAIVSATGHSLIKRRMKHEGALLAGEMSGHIFFADRYFGFDDAIYATARLLERLSQTGARPGELLADVPATSVTPEIRVDCPDDIKFDVVSAVLSHYRESHSVLDVDGARIDFGDGAWGLCRASNTGPVLVLRFEARDDARRDAIRAEVEGVVTKAREALSA